LSQHPRPNHPIGAAETARPSDGRALHPPKEEITTTWFNARPAVQQVLLVVGAVVFALIVVNSAANDSSKFSCGKLIDAIQRQAYDETGRPATQTELDYARDYTCARGGR
jgi:hypothetical protein